jgi:DNA (cytosine-5)-methyltransferase 1
MEIIKNMRAVELFAGAGGLGIGVSRAGFKPAAVIEWNRYCCDTIRENQAIGLKPVVDWPLTEGDVRNFNFRELSGETDLITGGPPCQPFSLGGKHRGFLDERDMFPQAIRAVRELQPKAFIFENVKGLTRASFASYLEYIRLRLTYPEIIERNGEEWERHLSRLERHHTQGKHDGLHYNLVIRLLNAANYGIPQRRERVFIVGFRSDLGIKWAFPDETHSQDALLWSQWQTGEYWDTHKVSKRQRPEGGKGQLRAMSLKEKPPLGPWLTVRDAISDLPDPETKPHAAAKYHNHRFQPGARSYPGHTGSPLDEPAKTLKAGDHGVPGGENMLLRPDGSVRYFTVRESARLQTFPDDFLFHGSWTETMRQLGNAVPVNLAEIIAKSVAATLWKQEEKSGNHI